MSAGQTMKASRNIISSEFHLLTWGDSSNPMSAFNAIFTRITPVSSNPLALNPLPTAPDFLFPALSAVEIGANLDAGEGMIGICVDVMFGRADELADNEAEVN